MITQTRVTATGTEYWDNVAKKVLFVPTGKEPNFEVTENPKSMLIGVDLATSKDKTAINGKVIVPDFDSMTVSQLRDYAAEQKIEIPADVKKRDDIIKLLSGNE